MTSHRRLLLAWLALAVLIGGCGYSLAGNLPPVVVPIFKLLSRPTPF